MGRTSNLTSAIVPLTACVEQDGRQAVRADIRATADAITEKIATYRVDRAIETPRVLIPTTDAAFLLATLAACQAARATGVPFADTSGKPQQELSSLVDADCILTGGDDKPPRLEPLSPVEPKRRPWLGDVILTTTGSTGSKKGVCLTLEQLVQNAIAAGHFIGLAPGVRWASTTQLALTSGLCHMLMAWLNGATYLHCHGLEGPELAATLDSDTFGFGGAPIHLSNLADLDVRPPAIAMSSGDFLTAPVVRKLRGAFPDTHLYKFYGLTEVAGRLCALPHTLIDESPDATGVPIHGASIRVRRDDGEDASAGELGEVCARSPMLMLGYLRDGNDFAPVESGSWFATRDEGFIDDRGILTLTGRLDLSFKVGGEKASALAIERVVAAVLGDRPYCVLPVPHDALGQCAALFVESESEDGLWRAAQSCVARTLPSRFVPMFGYSVPQMPRLANGKIDRQTLLRDLGSYARLR